MDSVSKAEPTGTSLRHQPPRTWHTKLKRIALICLISALLLLLLPGASGTWFVHCTLPQTSGTLTVGGLQHRISVERDLWGVPHIAASTLHDVMFAQGYVTAQDRLFQMELNRRIAQGQLAQTFDPPNYNQVTVPSMREIIDLSNLDNSLWIITTGESGQPFSAHYNDLNPLWNKNQYQQMDFSSQIGKQAIREVLILQPSSFSYTTHLEGTFTATNSISGNYSPVPLQLLAQTVAR